MDRLNDNEVKEVAEMQSKINSYEAFILALGLMMNSDHDIDYPMFTNTNLDKMMHRIWKWFKKHKNK